MTPVEKSAAVFEEWCGSAAPVGTEATGVQHLLAAWQGREFGATPIEHSALGVSEEVGELHHAILKHLQKIRGMGEPAEFREAAGDAIADATIYLMQIATTLRLDFATLVYETAYEVMKRTWRVDPANGGLADKKKASK